MFMLYLGAVGTAESVGIARIWETALGAGVAVAVAVTLWPPDPLTEARQRLARLRRWLGEDLAGLARLVRDPEPDAADARLDVVRGRSLHAVRDVFEVERGRRALRWNPRRRRDEAAFAVVDRRLNGAARQYRHLRTVTRIVADAARLDTIPDAERSRLGGALDSLAASAADGGAPRHSPIDPASFADPRASGWRWSSGRWSRTCPSEREMSERR